MTPEAASEAQIERYRQMTGEQRLEIALRLHELSCESQRDSVSKPRVARNELPWGLIVRTWSTPTGLCRFRRAPRATTPLGLPDFSSASPRVAHSSQPWAGGRNPFGIGARRPTKAPAKFRRCAMSSSARLRLAHSATSCRSYGAWLDVLAIANYEHGAPNGAFRIVAPLPGNYL
jgi:hypothetical protein